MIVRLTRCIHFLYAENRENGCIRHLGHFVSATPLRTHNRPRVNLCRVFFHATLRGSQKLPATLGSKQHASSRRTLACCRVSVAESDESTRPSVFESLRTSFTVNTPKSVNGLQHNDESKSQDTRTSIVRHGGLSYPAVLFSA